MFGLKGGFCCQTFQVKSRAPGRVWHCEAVAGSGAERIGNPWGQWDGWHPVSPIPKKGESRAGHPVRETKQHQDSAGRALQESEGAHESRVTHCLEKGTLMRQVTPWISICSPLYLQLILSSLCSLCGISNLMFLTWICSYTQTISSEISWLCFAFLLQAKSYSVYFMLIFTPCSISDQKQSRNYSILVLFGY